MVRIAFAALALVHELRLLRSDRARSGVKIDTEVHEGERTSARPPVLVLHGGLRATDIMASTARSR